MAYTLDWNSMGRLGTIWVVAGLLASACTVPTTEAGTLPDGDESSDGSSPDDDDDDDMMGTECPLTSCFNSCFVTIPGTAGECTEPAPDYVPWDCDMAPACPAFTLDPTGTCDDGTTCFADGECDGACTPIAAVPVDDAHCALTALRDATPGEIRMEWIDAVLNDGTVLGGTLDVYVVGDGTVLLDLVHVEAVTCNGQSRPLQSRFAEVVAADDALWEPCLEATSKDELLACFVGESFFVDPDGDPLPWLQGSCVAAEPACP